MNKLIKTPPPQKICDTKSVFKWSKIVFSPIFFLRD